MRPRARAAFVLAIVWLLLAALPARAALFDDDEARKRIEVLRGRVDTLERSILQRLDELEAKNQALVDLFRDVEQIKADLGKLRGQYEVLTYELEQAQKRQRDLYLDLDSRLRKLESAPGAGAAPASGLPAGADAATAAAAGPSGSPATTLAGASATPGRLGASDMASEQRAYDVALEQFKSGNFASAIAGFQSFVKSYPKSPLAPSALYWAGNAQYAQKEFRAAIATQRQLIAAYPDSQKVPDALLNIASCQTELGDAPGAKRSLQDIVARYPTSEAAAKARQRLATGR